MFTAPYSRLHIVAHNERAEHTVQADVQRLPSLPPRPSSPPVLVDARPNARLPVIPTQPTARCATAQCLSTRYIDSTVCATTTTTQSARDPTAKGGDSASCSASVDHRASRANLAAQVRRYHSASRHHHYTVLPNHTIGIRNGKSVTRQIYIPGATQALQAARPAQGGDEPDVVGRLAPA
jgi:hypothetical protein